jgi:hypothetical protein
LAWVATVARKVLDADPIESENDRRLAINRAVGLTGRDTSGNHAIGVLALDLGITDWSALTADEKRKFRGVVRAMLGLVGADDDTAEEAIDARIRRVLKGD